MAGKPTGWNRLVAKLQGEVPAAELEAFRRASGPVLELLEQVERRRLECSIDGLDPWTVPPATRAVFLCAWNAFVLQTLGNEYLDADYRAEPRTPHFVPPVTAEQVLRFYEPVEAWVNRALQAQANPDYRLDVDIPAALPALQVEPLPSAHLDALLHAMRSVRDHAGAALEFLPATPPAEREKQMQLNRIRQLYASAQARARYAEDLCGTDPVPEVRERAGEHARAAIAQLYLLGQLVSDPGLAAGRASAPAVPRRGTPARTPAALPARPVVEKPARSLAPAAAIGLASDRPRAAANPTVPSAAPEAVRTGRSAAKPPGLHLATRHDPSRSQTITEAAETIDFTGDLSPELHFSLRLMQVRRPESVSVVLRVTGWSYDTYPLLTTGTLTIETDGQQSVLRPLPDRKRRSSHQREQTSYEEDLGYELPDGLLQKLGSTGHAGLCFKNYRGTVEVDAATVARFRAYCRSFYDAVV